MKKTTAKLLEPIRRNATQRAYTTDVRLYISYTSSRDPADPENLLDYLADHSTKYRVATLRRKAVAITQYFGIRDKRIRIMLAHIAQKFGVPQEQASALNPQDIARMCDMIGTEKRIDIRNRALILVGFCAGLRRSEIANLKWQDIEINNIATTINIQAAKTDRANQGQKITLRRLYNRYCPVEALETLKKSQENSTQFVFPAMTKFDTIVNKPINDKMVSLIVKHYAKMAGLTGHYSAHSLRRGCATSAAQQKYSIAEIMHHTRHKSVSIAASYIDAVNTVNIMEVAS